MFISKVKMQALILALSAVPVFKIKFEFSDKGTHPQDKHSRSWESKGWCELLWWVGAKQHEFCDFMQIRPSQMRFEWP